MEARLSPLACQRARAERTSHLDQMYLTLMIQPRLIGLDVMVSPAVAAARAAQAAASPVRSAIRPTLSGIIAFQQRASPSQSMLRSEALGTSRALHISAATIQRTCA